MLEETGKVNFRKDSWTKLKSIYLHEMDLEWNEFNITALMFFIHQILKFLLWISNLIHHGNAAKHPRQDVVTAFVYLIEGIEICLICICLNAEHNPHFYLNRERMHISGGHRHHHRAHRNHGKTKRHNVLNGPLVTLILFAFLLEFIDFLSYPSVNIEDFNESITEAYNCRSADDLCSYKAHFVVNELILRIFVGVTLLNLIFFLLSVIFGETPHSASFNGARNLIRPAGFTVFMILIILEMALIQNNYETDMIINNLCWSVINGFSAILCVYYTVNHIKGDRRNQWDRLNIATKYEGLLLLVLRTVALSFVYLYEHAKDHEDWTVYRQIVVTVTMYFHMGCLWMLKKPGYYHDGIQFLLKFITYINGYNLVFSLIFETSHFLDLFEKVTSDTSSGSVYPVQNAGDDGSTQSYFLVSFSTSFAVAHSNLWFLGQFWEWTQRRADRKSTGFKHHHSNPKGSGKLMTPNQFSEMKQLSTVRNEYSTYSTFYA